MRRACGILAMVITAGVGHTQKNPPEIVAEAPSLKERAIGAERRGDLAKAAQLYLDLTRQDPQEVKWVLAAGRCLGRVGRYNDSLDLLERSFGRFSDVIEIPALVAKTYVLKAEASVAQGVRDVNVTLNFEEAVRVARSVVQRHPGHKDARLILAKAHFQLAEMEEAHKHAREAVRRFPRHQGGHVLLGDIAYQRFVTLRNQINVENPRGRQQADLLAQAAAERERASRAYAKAAEIDNTRAYPRVRLGDLQAWNGNTEQALLMYQEALAVDPTTTVNHSWITTNVESERRTELYRNATEAYRKKPGMEKGKLATLYWYLAYALLEKRDFKASHLTFSKAAKANPLFQNSHYYAMLAAYWGGEEAVAQAHAWHYASQNAAGFADLIRSPVEAKRKDEVLGILEYFAQSSFKADRLPESRDLNHILAKVKATAPHWNNYAFLCRETGKFEDSLSAYQNALSLDPDSPQLLNDTAVILQYHLPTRENLTMAATYYRRVLVEATRVLNDPKASDEKKTRTRQARQDATGNLKKMGKQ